jgi:hypothetical protein
MIERKSLNATGRERTQLPALPKPVSVMSEGPNRRIVTVSMESDGLPSLLEAPILKDAESI